MYRVDSFFSKRTTRKEHSVSKINLCGIATVFVAAYLLLSFEGALAAVSGERHSLLPNLRVANASRNQDGRGLLQITAMPVGGEPRRSLASIPSGGVTSTYLVPKNTFSLTTGFKVLDGGSIGTQALLNDRAASSSQVFSIIDSGEIQLASVTTGNKVCLDITGIRYTDGTPIELWPCNNGLNQKWNFTPASGVGGNVYYTITSAGQSNYCLDVTAFGNSNGTPIELWSCNNGANQQWTLISAG